LYSGWSVCIFKHFVNISMESGWENLWKCWFLRHLSASCLHWIHDNESTRKPSFYVTVCLNKTIFQKIDVWKQDNKALGKKKDVQVRECNLIPMSISPLYAMLLDTRNTCMQQPLAYIFQTLFQHEVFVITPTLNAGSRCRSCYHWAILYYWRTCSGSKSIAKNMADLTPFPWQHLLYFHGNCHWPTAILSFRWCP
jgi:hypothetical protein